MCNYSISVPLGLTSSDVEPVLITGGQLLVLTQLDKVNPVRHLQLS